MDEDKRLKMAIIAGAAKAIRYKERKPRATEQEIIQKVASEVKDILKKIDKDLD